MSRIRKSNRLHVHAGSTDEQHVDTNIMNPGVQEAILATSVYAQNLP